MMKPLDISKYRVMLEEQGREIAEIERPDEGTAPEGSNTPEDPMGVANPSSEVNMGLLREIDYALERIRDGDYGRCEECEREIAGARLEALPWARRCLSCEQEREEAA